MPALDPGRTALVLVDLMEPIVAPPFARRPGTDIVAATLPAATFRTAGAPVVRIRAERPHIDIQPLGSELVPAPVTPGGPE
ncbi:hypothetical protein [Streptomyces sp. NPDC006551]|uniref:hypothetical protein n=1 Tax=Streptomyces sp. NPDC006551 TaxID=3157178 RepID=UPI0033A19F81